MGKIKVLIADDEVLMRDGLKTILELEDDMEVAGMAGNGHQALELATRLEPDVVLMDVRMPLMDGVESARQIKKRCPGVKVIMLTTFDHDEYIINALAGGADGFLLKDIQADQLIDAVRNATGGQMILPARVASKLASRAAGLLSNDDSINLDGIELSPREMDVAALMVKGYSNRQIAGSLGLTEGTVKNYISMIYDKLGTSDRRRAVTYLTRLLR